MSDETDLEFAVDAIFRLAHAAHASRPIDEAGLRAATFRARERILERGWEWDAGETPSVRKKDEPPKLDRTVHDLAALYQTATGVGLPFSNPDAAVMIAALEKSFRDREVELRCLRRRNFILREFIETLSKLPEKGE